MKYKYIIFVILPLLMWGCKGYKVVNNPYVILQRGEITAIIANNQAIDDEFLPGHREHYSGVASLTHSDNRENFDNGQRTETINRNTTGHGANALGNFSRGYAQANHRVTQA